MFRAFLYFIECKSQQRGSKFSPPATVVVTALAAIRRTMAKKVKAKTFVVRRAPLLKREVDIIRRLKNVVKLPITKIALAVNRNKSTVYSALDKTWTTSKRGRPDLLSKAQVNLLVRTTRAMIKKAAAKKEVTLAMIKKKSKLKVSAKVLRKALHKRNIRFRKMRSKPLLTKADIADRLKFAQKFRRKSRAWWKRNVHMYIDLKSFPVYPNAAAREYAARREVRGAYRAPSQGLDAAYVVIPKHLKYNTGMKKATIAGGVGNGRVGLWHDIGKTWSGKVASDLYAGPIRTALRRAHPCKRSYQVLEDNDPTGFKSALGVRAKKAAKIKVLAIPKRSPDLSVMDYAVWKKITSTMRLQERRFKKSRKETRAQFLARLHRVAKSLPASFINKAIGNMKERCERLYKAKGHHFEEGGKSFFVK